jgi:hypothetical protein
MICQLRYGDAIVSFAIVTKAIGFNQGVLARDHVRHGLIALSPYYEQCIQMASQL